ncbi:molybdopterin-binding protein, partial [Thermodesulfobacteriota bacterium]
MDKAVDGECDIVLIVAGSSAGSKDHTVHVVQDLGQVLVHGVTIMPGKPVVLGAVRDKPVIGIPQSSMLLRTDAY